MKKNFGLALLAAFSISLSTFNPVYAEEATPPSVTSAPVEVDLSLNHMSLTAAQIRKRDRLLKPIYDNYQNVNLSSVSNALEQAYGANVFHYNTESKLTLGNKKGVMENAVRYYMGIESLFDQADASVIPLKNSVKMIAPRTYSNDTGLSGWVSVQAPLIKGDTDKFNETAEIKSPSLLATEVHSRRNEDPIFRMNIGTSRAVYSTTMDPLFSAPVMGEFLDAMNALNLRGLDATINFTSGTLQNNKMYHVVYPHFSKIAPIPQPVIFLSKDARYADILEMLEEHAPRIFAHNHLFNAKVLPSVQEINDLLRKHPNILEEVSRVRGTVGRQNLVNAIQGAFLTLTYGVGAGVVGTAALLAAPVTIYAMAASPILSPLFIAKIIIFL